MEIIKLAAATYDRLKLSGAWDVPKTARARSYNVTPNSATPPVRDGPPVRNGPNIDCFNCGRHGHGVSDCTQPLDQARIDRNRAAFFDRRRNSRPPPRPGPNRGPPRGRRPPPPIRRGPPGLPNRRGAYMLDQRRARAENRRLLQAALNQQAPAPAPTQAPIPNGSPLGNDQVSAPVHAVQDLLRSLL